VTGHVSGNRSADPPANLHGVTVEPEQQPAAIRKDDFSAAPIGCATCLWAILTVWQQHSDSQSASPMALDTARLKLNITINMMEIRFCIIKTIP
jgi:hypothetical protein